MRALDKQFANLLAGEPAIISVLYQIEAEFQNNHDCTEARIEE